MKNAVAAFDMHPDAVLLEQPDGTAWLLHMSANTSRLDAQATELLKSIIDVGPERAIRSLVDAFDVDEHEVRDDVSTFLGGMLAQNILQPRHAGPRAQAVRADKWIDGALAIVERLFRNPRRRAWGFLLVARWAVARFGWARTIETWERRYRQPAPDRAIHDPMLRQRIDVTVRETAARSWLHHECKERALACLALARSARMRADLLIGVTYLPLAAHVWVECDEHVISDLPEHCRPFEIVVRYDGSAARSR